MPRIRRVCIIGAGLSGLATALAAAAAGCEVDVFAATPAPTRAAEQVDLGPNALRGLAELGLGEAVAAAGFAYRGIGFVTVRGEPLFEIETPRRAGPRLPAAVGIGHATLLRLLADAAERAGARLHAGVQVEAGGRGGAAAPIVFSDRRAASADLVVLAAGLDAALRRTLFPDAPAPERFGQDWWQALLPRPPSLDRATWVVGPENRKLLLLPVSVANAGVALSRPSAALVDCEAGDASRGASLRAALAFAAALLPSLDGRLGAVAEISVRPVRAALLPAPWFRGHVLGVGDCAHALPPHFGQATAQSVEDAVVLGQLLRGNVDRDALLADFAARRCARVGRVHALVTQAARWVRRPVPRTDLRALATELDAVVALPA